MLTGAEVPLYLNDTSCFRLTTGNQREWKKNTNDGTGTREDLHDRELECVWLM